MSDVTDFLGNPLEIDDYFAYSLTLGRSSQLAIFQYKGKNESGTFSARPVTRSYAHKETGIYIRDENDPRWDPNGNTWGQYVTMTESEVAAAAAKALKKRSTLHCVSERAIKLFNFKEQQ